MGASGEGGAPVLVIVPALNEQDTVGAVVAAVRSQLRADVVVIDDGSRDATAARATAAGAAVLRHPFNLGVGAALRTGFRWARSQGYRRAAQVDADGQHEVADVSALLAALDAGADLAVGSRFSAGYEASAVRRAGMRALSARVSRSLGVQITDTTSGFRAFGPRAIDRFAAAYPSAYLSDTVEALLLAGDWGLQVREVPVRMHHRQGGRPSAGTLKSTYHMARLGLVVGLHRFRRPLYAHGGAS